MRLGRPGYLAIEAIGIALVCLVLSFQFERSEFGMQSGLAGLLLVSAAAVLFSFGLYAAWLDARRLVRRTPGIRIRLAVGLICTVIGTLSTAMLSWAYTIIELRVLGG